MMICKGEEIPIVEIEGCGYDQYGCYVRHYKRKVQELPERQNMKILHAVKCLRVDLYDEVDKDNN